jgi:hypothetical protein
VLLGDALGRSTAWLFAHGDIDVDPQIIDAQLQRRLAGEPLQYIRGRCDFYGREFVVDDRVLIPRPETELVVEEAIKRAPRGACVVDVGTGSGCIAISLALERTDLRVVGVDISMGALAVAKRNAERLGARVVFVASDFLDAFAGSGTPPGQPARTPALLGTRTRRELGTIVTTSGDSIRCSSPSMPTSRCFFDVCTFIRVVRNERKPGVSRTRPAR